MMFKDKTKHEPMMTRVPTSNVEFLWNLLRVVCREEPSVFFGVCFLEVGRLVIVGSVVVVKQLEGNKSTL